MAFNLTGMNVDLYFSVNIAINVGIFSLLILPSFILCLLCVVALLFAEEINWPMRVLIINILASEIVFWVAFSFLILGFVPRLYITDEGSISCRIAYSLAITSSLTKFSAVAFYAINVFIFIRYGLKMVKWSIIVPYVVISWTFSFAVSSLPFLNHLEILVNNGFCDGNPSSPVFGVIVATTLLVIVIMLAITLVFSLLTYCYVKKNVLEDNVEIKRAVSKNLYYFAIASIFTLLYNVAPSASPSIKTALRDEGITAIIVINYVFLPDIFCLSIHIISYCSYYCSKATLTSYEARS